MLRRRHSVSLSRASSETFEEDVNPNAFLSNITDCMLVLALGFLVAFVARFGLDLQKPVEEEEPRMTGIEVNMDANADGSIDDQYEQRGSVYYDAQTDTYYFVQD